MTAKIMLLKNATRYPIEDDHDTLEFTKGVNVLVGELNAGKTKWLQMIDFVLGDAGKPEEAFDRELAEKYDRATLTLDIDGDEINVERRWKDAGAKTKIFVNDEGMTSKQFSEFMLEKLNIPLIHIPSGNPYADRSWPTLSWRELFRHMYKQERFWSDFAQKQTEAVRSACILHFLDAATSLYSSELGALVAKRKEKDRLEAQKEVFVRVLQDIAIDVVRQPEMTVAITPDSLREARRRLSERLIEIDDARKEALTNFDREAVASTPSFETAKQVLETLHQELSKVESERNSLVHRSTEIADYTKTLESELARFKRAKAGASVLADLKVTHCPACDQEVPHRSQDPNLCPVCGNTRIAAIDDASAGRRRIEFEEQQLSEELDELQRLIRELEQDLRACDNLISSIQQRILAKKRSIGVAQAFSVRAIPPEIAFLDQEAGGITEQMQQLDSIERAFGAREEMNSKIVVLEEEIAELDANIKQMNSHLDYRGLGDLLGDRMNDYLNSVNADELSRWRTGRISIKLRSDTFDLYLDGQPWTIRAGGTANYIIQIAYHYGLFSLSKDGQYNYPGFLIIDFPPHFSKAGDLRNSENYLLKPFVDLCGQKNMSEAQVIIAGRAFDELDNAHIIAL